MTKSTKPVRNGSISWDYEAEYRLAIQKLWPDLLVKVDERIFSTHRHLFIHYCDYFKDFFGRVYDQYPEQRKSIMTITLSEFSSSNIARIINWMYTGGIELSNDNVAQLFLISKYFGIPALVSKASEFALNYMKAYVDFYEMCCHLSPMAPACFYSSLELGYLSPFSCDSFLDEVKEYILDPLPYHERGKELHYSKEWKEFKIQFDLDDASEVMQYLPLNCTPIPLKTLNTILHEKCHPKSTILKSQYINKKNKYLTAHEGPIERKQSAKISSATTLAPKTSPLPPSSSSKSQTTALPESKGSDTVSAPPPPPSAKSQATAPSKSNGTAPPPPPSAKSQATASSKSNGTAPPPPPPPPPTVMEESSTAKQTGSKEQALNTSDKEVSKGVKPAGSNAPPAPAHPKPAAPNAPAAPAHPKPAAPNAPAAPAHPKPAAPNAPPAPAHPKPATPNAPAAPAHSKTTPPAAAAPAPPAHAPSKPEAVKTPSKPGAAPAHAPSKPEAVKTPSKPGAAAPPAPAPAPVATPSGTAGTPPEGKKPIPPAPPLPPK